MTKWLVEGLALAAILAMVAMTLIHWEELPATIPIHFGISGKPDGWGAKDSIWILPVLAVFVNVALSMAAAFPTMQNLPFAVDRTHPGVQRLLAEMTRTLKACVVMVLAMLNWFMLEVALGRRPGLGPLFLPFILAMIFLPVGFYLVRLRQI